MLKVQTILHPTDFSRHAAQAFEVACLLAKNAGARVLVLHVAEVPLQTLGGTAALPPLPEELGLGEQRHTLDKIRSPVPGVAVEHLLAEGGAGAEILRTARERSCDLIVMGTHGRSALGRLLMGSVAATVQHQAPCLVVTVNPPAA